MKGLRRRAQRIGDICFPVSSDKSQSLILVNFASPSRGVTCPFLVVFGYIFKIRTCIKRERKLYFMEDKAILTASSSAKARLPAMAGDFMKARFVPDSTSTFSDAMAAEGSVPLSLSLEKDKLAAFLIRVNSDSCFDDLSFAIFEKQPRDILEARPIKSEFVSEQHLLKGYH